MSRADELLAQYETKIARVGQWIAIRRYAGAGLTRTFSDTLTRAYVLYDLDTQLVGTVVQAHIRAYALVDMLAPIMPVNTNDRLMTRFTGIDNPDVPPTLTAGLVSGGHESAIKSVMERMPCGTLICLVLDAVG